MSFAKSKDYLDQRYQFCDGKIIELKKRIEKLKKENYLSSNLCIYVTGSYGRFEASTNSDLDLFFLQNGIKNSKRISKISKILLDSEIIKITRGMGFTDFSNDGQYLEIHNVKNMLANLGCPDDDFKNYFTARMLLLLESKPIYNKKLYDKILNEVISSYYRDYHDHDKDFRPIFLVNDIIRFWKTLCLNYEHKRSRKTNDLEKKNSTHLKNLKLKFSRLLTCFSTVCLLVQNKKVITPSSLIKFTSLTPIERLIEATKGIKSKKILNNIIEDYVWFLEITGQQPHDVLDWIGKKSNRDLAFNRGRKFGMSVFEILFEISETKDLRYLII